MEPWWAFSSNFIYTTLNYAGLHICNLDFVITSTLEQLMHAVQVSYAELTSTPNFISTFLNHLTPCRFVVDAGNLPGSHFYAAPSSYLCYFSCSSTCEQRTGCLSLGLMSFQPMQDSIALEVSAWSYPYQWIWLFYKIITRKKKVPETKIKTFSSKPANAIYQAFPSFERE